MNATYNNITDAQTEAIKEAAQVCSCSVNDMTKFFVDGGEWDAEDSLALANLLIECWMETP